VSLTSRLKRAARLAVRFFGGARTLGRRTAYNRRAAARKAQRKSKVKRQKAKEGHVGVEL
jgi:hypothetical protein